MPFDNPTLGFSVTAFESYTRTSLLRNSWRCQPSNSSWSSFPTRRLPETRRIRLPSNLHASPIDSPASIRKVARASLNVDRGLTLNGTEQAFTVVGRATGTSQKMPTASARAGRTEKHFLWRNIGSPSATPKTMESVNSDADFLTRHAAQTASRFHHTAKILLTAAPVWTLVATAVDRAAVGHVVASTHGLLRDRI